MKPKHATYHHVITKLLVDFYVLNKPIVNSIISDTLTNENMNVKIEGYQRFSLMWRLLDGMNITYRVFDDGLLLMLGCMQNDNSTLRLISKSWLLGTMKHVHRILDSLFCLLVDEESIKQKTQVFDERRSMYVLKLWLTILEVSPIEFIQSIIKTELSFDLIENYQTFLIKDVQNSIDSFN
jgi:hypothetical protein